MLRRAVFAMIWMSCAVASASVFAADAEPDPFLPVRNALEKGLVSLVALQGEDGGWHSETYGVLKPGVALTAHILDFMIVLPPDLGAKYKPAIAKGFAFLEKATGPDGGVGTHGEWHDYPVYATAYTVLALSRAQPEGWNERVAKHVEWLLAQQNNEASGCPRTHPAHGGWNPQGHVKGLPAHADLSTTSVVASVLAGQCNPLAPRSPLSIQLRNAFAAIDVYRSRCHNFVDDMNPNEVNDGGFVFTATRAELNKAGASADSAKSATGFKSYGAATADGLTLLEKQASFQRRDNPKQSDSQSRLETHIRVAKRWLDMNVSSEKMAGFGPNDPRAEAMQFYYRSVTVERIQSVDRALWVKQTLALQRPDGLFSNPNNRMKEDDPLIATPLALRTLLIYLPPEVNQLKER